MARVLSVLQLLLLFEVVIFASNVAAWVRNRRAARVAPAVRVLGAAAPPLPARLEALAGSLRELGFRPVGAAELSGGLFRQPQVSWLFTAPGRDVHAELMLVGRRGMGVLVTWFGDAVLETHIGGRLAFAEDDFVVQSAADVPGAYHAHTEALSAMRARVGDPTSIETMEAYQAYAAGYNQRFYGRKLARARTRLTIAVLVTLYGVAVIVASLLLGASGAIRAYPLLLLTVVLLVPAMLAEAITAIWWRRARRKK